MHPDDKESSMQKIIEVSNGQPVFSYRSRFITRNGNNRWFAWTATRSNEQGVIYCTGEDCTEKKETQDEMQKLSLIAKKTANGITITDKDRKIFGSMRPVSK